jgi:Icc-related predicted phosphoesterase
MPLIYELSDVHLEHYRDVNAAIKFLEYIRPVETADVLVLAGDIWSLHDETCLLFLDEFRKWAVEIVYAPGNHEWYNTSPKVNGKEMLDKLYNEGLRVLGPEYYESFTYEGMRFVGTTCWYPDNAIVRKKLMNWSDCAYIRGFMRWWEKFQLEERQHLWNNMQEGDIVVSHMLPIWDCVSPQFEADSYNCLYVADVADIIQELKPKIWFHGHSHDKQDFMFGDTRILRNPIGYPSELRLKNPEEVKILEIRL